jgi:RHS repeat-associated protein
LYQDGRFDATTGLFAFRNRDYSPTLGRWTRQDPIGFMAGDTNLYRYVHNAPSERVDPTGLFGLLGGGIGGLASAGFAFVRGLSRGDSAAEIGRAVAVAGVSGFVGGATGGYLLLGARAIGVPLALNTLGGAAATALSGIAGGQVSRLVENAIDILSGRKPSNELLNPVDMLQDGALSLLIGGLLNKLLTGSVAGKPCPKPTSSGRPEPVIAPERPSPIPEPVVGTEKPSTLHHGSPVPPEIIFEEGLRPPGTNMDLDAHIAGSADSGYVSGTITPEGAAPFAQDGGWVYEYDFPKRAVDVAEHIGGYGPYGNEAEFAAPHAIDPSTIIGAQPVGPGEQVIPNQYRPNPNYRGSQQ